MPPLFKTLTIVLFSLLDFKSFAQNFDKLPTIDLECPVYNSAAARADIQKGEAILFLQGATFIILSSDKEFSNRYHIKFDNYGCVAAAKKECMLAYNKVVFEHLDKTFGIGWRKVVRKDLLGFPEWNYD